MRRQEISRGRLEACCRAPSGWVRCRGTEVCGAAAGRPGSNECSEACHCGQELGFGSNGAFALPSKASDMMRNLRMDLTECQRLQVQCEQAQDAAKVSRAIHQRRDFLHVSGTQSPSARPSCEAQGLDRRPRGPWLVADMRRARHAEASTYSRTSRTSPRPEVMSRACLEACKSMKMMARNLVWVCGRVAKCLWRLYELRALHLWIPRRAIDAVQSRPKTGHAGDAGGIFGPVGSRRASPVCMSPLIRPVQLQSSTSQRQ